MKRIFGLTVVFIFLAGCTHMPGDYWSRSGVSQAILDADADHCLRQIPNIAQREISYFEQKDKRDQFISCMQANDYSLRYFTPEQEVKMAAMLPQARQHYVEALMADAYMSDSFVFVRADQTFTQ